MQLEVSKNADPISSAIKVVSKKEMSHDDVLSEAVKYCKWFRVNLCKSNMDCTKIHIFCEMGIIVRRPLSKRTYAKLEIEKGWSGSKPKKEKKRMSRKRLSTTESSITASRAAVEHNEIKIIHLVSDNANLEVFCHDSTCTI